MKVWKGCFIFVAVLLMFAGIGLAQSKAPAGPAGMDQLKILAGNWEGEEEGKVVRAIYKVISSNTAVMEILNPPDEHDMVTVFYPDGNRVMMTHYCATGNQPRMRAASVNGKEIQFQFMDATNLASSADGHMNGLTIQFDDADHITEKWTWRQNGQDAVHVFHFRRVKS
jgi:hypothetical protein